MRSALGAARAHASPRMRTGLRGLAPLRGAAPICDAPSCEPLAARRSSQDGYVDDGGAAREQGPTARSSRGARCENVVDQENAAFGHGLACGERVGRIPAPRATSQACLNLAAGSDEHLGRELSGARSAPREGAGEEGRLVEAAPAQLARVQGNRHDEVVAQRPCCRVLCEVPLECDTNLGIAAVLPARDRVGQHAAGAVGKARERPAKRWGPRRTSIAAGLRAGLTALQARVPDAAQVAQACSTKPRRASAVQLPATSCARRRVEKCQENVYNSHHGNQARVSPLSDQAHWSEARIADIVSYATERGPDRDG